MKGKTLLRESRNKNFGLFRINPPKNLECLTLLLSHSWLQLPDNFSLLHLQAVAQLEYIKKSLRRAVGGILTSLRSMKM